MVGKGGKRLEPGNLPASGPGPENQVSAAGGRGSGGPAPRCGRGGTPGSLGRLTRLGATVGVSGRPGVRTRAHEVGVFRGARRAEGRGRGGSEARR